MQESDNIVVLVAASASAAVAAAGVAVFLCLLVVFAAWGFVEADESTIEAYVGAAVRESGSFPRVSATQLEEQALAQSSDMPEDPSSLAAKAPGSEEAALASGEAQDIAASVEACLQNPSLLGGCEVASMTAVLHALGFDIDMIDFACNYVMKLPGEADMVHAYSGSPFEQGASFPPPMVHAGNNYLRIQDTPWRFVERKEATMSKLLQVVETGRPVLVWTTMYNKQPAMTEIFVEGYRWYSNEHCVVLYGQTESGKLKIMDPLEGLVERDRAQFEEIYVACGQHSATISAVITDEVDEREVDNAPNSEKAQDGSA